MKTTRVNLKRWLPAAFILAMFQHSVAQGLIDSLSNDENKIVASIAPYAPDVRAAILSVSQYPQVLVKLERTQARTSQSFQDLISAYPRAEQEKIYQATRFPELTSQLASMGRGKVEEVKLLLNEYPEGARQPILDVYQNHYEDLAKINTIYQSSQGTLEKIIAKYTPQLQGDFKKVVGSPDVMSLLTDNIDLTVSLGESYKADPKDVTEYLDSLNVQLTQQNTMDLDVYKKAVESDPKLQDEMKSAADEFAKQYDQAETNPTYVNSNYYGSSPYPYWFGYPYWYGSPMWYPTPFYYNTGFYYGLAGGLVVFGLPSFAYSNWFFGYGYHHYPLLYNHYNSYYNVHRANITNVNVYRGFNTAAHNHFNAVNLNSRQVEGRSINSGSRLTQTKSGNLNSGRSIQQPLRQGSFNNNSVNHYNANSFHTMGWQNMHSGGMVHGGGRGRH